nr:MAG TPA: hypothetical protein [Caudoviricetes sp.]
MCSKLDVRYKPIIPLAPVTKIEANSATPSPSRIAHLFTIIIPQFLLIANTF